MPAIDNEGRNVLKVKVKVTSRIYIADRKTFVLSAPLNQFTRRNRGITHSSIEEGVHDLGGGTKQK